MSEVCLTVQHRVSPSGVRAALSGLVNGHGHNIADINDGGGRIRSTARCVKEQVFTSLLDGLRLFAARGNARRR